MGVGQNIILWGVSTCQSQSLRLEATHTAMDFNGKYKGQSKNAVPPLPNTELFAP